MIFVYTLLFCMSIIGILIYLISNYLVFKNHHQYIKNFEFNSLQHTLKMLKNVPGVEAAFLDDINNKQIKVYLVAAEQHLIDIDIIIKAEEIFERATGRDLEFIAWAHQGRDLDSLLPGMKRIF